MHVINLASVLAFLLLPRPPDDQGQVPADGERGVNTGSRNKVDLTSVKDLVPGI